MENARMTQWFGRVVWTAVVALALVGSSVADSVLVLDPEAGEVPVSSPVVQVIETDGTGLQVSVDVPALTVRPVKTPAGMFALLEGPNMPQAGTPGTPALPVVRELIWMPLGATAEVSVRPGVSQTLSLAELTIADRLHPVQPAVSMATPLADAPFCFDAESYDRASWTPSARAVVTPMGVVRGAQLALLEIRPIAYHPRTGQLRTWSHLDVKVRFTGGSPADHDLGSMRSLNAVTLNPRVDEGAGRTAENYLIVVEDWFVADILPLSNYRAAEGYNVITQTFTQGLTGDDIKARIQTLWGTPDAPDHLLLVGDTNRIPAWIGGGTRMAATDLPYACMDAGDDWFPDMTVGRFPARISAQADAMVDKTLTIANGVFTDPSYAKRAAFLAGTDSSSGDHATHDWVIDNLLTPEDFVSSRLYQREGATTQDVLNAFNAGSLFGAYFGHSNSGYMYNGPATNQDDIRSLTNDGLYTIYLANSCGNLKYTVVECIGETWMVEANKGAAVFIGASDYIYWTTPPWHQSSNMEKFFFDSIYTDGIRQVGPALNNTKARLLAFYGANDPASRDYFELFNMMGDPVLSVPYAGPELTLAVSPRSLGTCMPDDAEFTVEVGEVQGFAEPVLLTASGIPTGTTASFDVNNQVPPFTSTLTISNTGSGTPGEYSLDVQAAAASMSRSKSIELLLSDTTAGDVALVSPLDGEVDVGRFPDLAWSTSSSAFSYELQVALDPAFTNLVYTYTLAEESHAVEQMLDTLTTHYWRVRGVNGCGPGNWSPTFSFTTVEQLDYFTEEIESAFDLGYYRLRFVPNSTALRYDVCGSAATSLGTDPTGGTVLTLSDDSYTHMQLYGGHVFPFYDGVYDRCYIGSNGYITMTGGDDSYEPTLDSHFDRPRISALFDDLDPAQGGQVTTLELADRAVVTFDGVPEHNGNNANTFQVEMFYTGEIHITWLQVDSTGPLVGLSEGFGVPLDYLESNLSGYAMCQGDFDNDGDVDADDFDVFFDCMAGPDVFSAPPGCAVDEFTESDFDASGTVDLADYLLFSELFSGAH